MSEIIEENVTNEELTESDTHECVIVGEDKEELRRKLNSEV